jgi:hypothetical protein
MWIPEPIDRILELSEAIQRHHFWARNRKEEAAGGTGGEQLSEVVALPAGCRSLTTEERRLRLPPSIAPGRPN